MKRIPILAAAALAAALLSPAGEGDVGDLIPVELLYVYSSEGRIWMETDTGQMGAGETVEAAMEDLKQTAPGDVFLETADYLVLAEEMLGVLPKLTGFLRPSARVCLGAWVDEHAVPFLRAHKPEVTLNDIRAGERILPVLIFSEGRYRIES